MVSRSHMLRSKFKADAAGCPGDCDGCHMNSILSMLMPGAFSQCRWRSVCLANHSTFAHEMCHTQCREAARSDSLLRTHTLSPGRCSPARPHGGEQERRGPALGSIRH
jgi:hypothetical protein